MKQIIFLFMFSVLTVFFLFFTTANKEQLVKNFSGSKNFLEEGLVAEANQDWENALKIYKKIIANEPNNLSLLLRIADIENSLKNYENAEHVLNQAQILQPKNISIHVKLSETYAIEGKANEALLTIEKALQLDPNNIDYLKKRVVLASWVGDKAKVEDSYTRILKLEPNNQDIFLKLTLLKKEKNKSIPVKNKPKDAILAIENALKLEPNNILKLDPKNRDVILDIARLKTSQNLLDAAVRDYKHYLTLYSDSRSVWIDYAKVQSWRGNFRSAFKAMEIYQKKYGSTKEYKIEKARLLAMAGYPKSSLCMLKPLLKQFPTNYDLVFTKILALQNNNQATDALETLYQLNKIHPNHPDNLMLKKIVTIPIFSSINVEPYRSHDTDGINIKRLKLYGQYYITPETKLVYDLKHENLYEAQINSGLQTIDNHPKIWNNAQKIGISSYLLPELQVEGRLGVAEIQRLKKYFVYHLNSIINPTETSEIIFQRGREIYAPSPRSVSLAIRETYNKVNIIWEPLTQFYFVGQGERSTFSDKNRLSLMRIAPRAGVVRSQFLNVDLGVMTDWLHFSQKLNHGYYDPRLHRTYQVTSFINVKQSQNINYVLSVGLGKHKDETMKKFAFAGDLTVQAMFGILDDWKFILTASDSQRQANTMDQRQINGNYRAYFISAVLSRRF